jgi:hypothetical protein
MRDDAAQYLQSTKKTFSSVLTYRDQSPKYHNLFYSSAKQNALKSDILVFWDIVFVWLGARLSKVLRNLLTLPLFSHKKIESNVFS